MDSCIHIHTYIHTCVSQSPWLVGYLLTYNNTMTVSFKWRFLLGLGALPLLISSALLWFEEFLKRKQGPYLIFTA